MYLFLDNPLAVGELLTSDLLFALLLLLLALPTMRLL